MSPRPKGRTSKSDLQERITAAAWKQIAAEGAPALSLRAIARALNISAPSIYNYFSDRDALVTALIVEAFQTFANHLHTAIVDLPLDNHSQRLYALGLAYRDWAVTFPERYQLIFGTPLAGYTAPFEITQPVAGRSLAILVNVLQAGFEAGKLQILADLPMSPQLQTMFEAWQRERGAIDKYVLCLAVAIWAQVHGLVSVEIGHQYPPFLNDPGELYRYYLSQIISRYYSVD